MGQPRDCLGDRTECSVMVMAASMAVTRHGHIDDILFDLAQLLIAEAPFVQHPGAEILDHNVGDGDQPLHDLQALRASYIQTEALFVDVGVIEVSRGVQIDLEILRRGGTRQPAAFILRPLDFYDLGAETPEPARGPRPGPYPAEVPNSDVFKGSPSKRTGQVGIVIVRSPCVIVCRMPRSRKLGSLVSSIESRTAPAGTPTELSCAIASRLVRCRVQPVTISSTSASRCKRASGVS